MRLTKSNQKLGSLNKPSISKSEKYKQLVGDVKKISEAIDNYRNHKTNYFAACKKWRMVDCTMRKISSFKAHEKKIYDCKFSHHNPDLVISVANDKKLKYWNVHDKKLLKVI
ncbi:hypothetical protein MHBO_002128 [Bonamia ostreae]|uniref:Uncharacterized protein n=1 Tax=Bonamia ostreae TaxID=126728 RepID=A0ABV2ALB0_9EUKA